MTTESFITGPIDGETPPEFITIVNPVLSAGYYKLGYLAIGQQAASEGIGSVILNLRTIGFTSGTGL